VEQLQQTLAAQRAANKADGDMAAQVASLELTEQLTAPTLDRMTTDFKLGPKAVQTLELLADNSILLAPPAGELPADAKPDIATQRTMINAALTYVAGTLHHLPDFLATRATLSFDDSPLVVGHSGFAPRADLHQVGTFSRDITYRNGREVFDSADAATGSKHKAAPGPPGLSSWGEFGPVLAIVLTDSIKGRVTWSRWERTSAGQVAVFHFTVPKEASHYAVDFCCAWKSMDDLGVSDPANKPLAYHDTPGYHGELYLDPANGAILRIALEAELKDSDLITRAAVSVQYGKVEIGGNSYLCPVRSVAISADRNRPGKTEGGADAQVTRINEVTFINYHRFGSTVRVLSDPPAQ
jgi:hypothetical protein